MPDEETLRQHPEFTQVVLDVNRSLKRFPPGIPYEQRVALQDQLTNLILRVITKYPHLRYYQGYHDVAVTFLLVVGEELSFRIMERLSTDHLRDCMEPTMEKTSHLLNYIYPLIHRLHPRLCQYLEQSGVGTMFCLPWFLTWFGHSLNHYKDVVRLYDFFLATHPLTPLYLSAVIVVHRQEEIFTTDCDMASIHCLLSQIPDDLPFQTLIEETLDLFEKFPPISVENEVIERTNKEREQRKAEEAVRLAKRRHREVGLKWQIQRYLPTSRTQLILIAMSVALGLYTYLRGDSDHPFPAR
ncbi:hypothetical protein AAG570_001019 [Ranatra chinensis]|uniref:Rab-GAP TBC domain-containing protein n=1 Tax=Ranatra chinensis TaxID=642074 RepID=A0ABD0YAM0_9HEMI